MNDLDWPTIFARPFHLNNARQAQSIHLSLPIPRPAANMNFQSLLEFLP